MDLDKEFIGAVCRGGKSAYRYVIDRGIDPEVHLFGDGKVAWEYLVKHLKEYDEIPNTDIIVTKAECDLVTQSNESYEFFLDEILLRRTSYVCTEGIKSVLDKLDKRDPKEAALEWAEVNRQIQTEQLGDRKVESLLSLGKLVIEDYQDAKAGKRGITTPWKTMDNQTLGWWPEDLIIFVGRLGVGKTWTLVLCAHAAWKSGKKVLIISTEMPKRQMARRFFSLHLRATYDDVRRGKLGDFAEPKFLDGIMGIMGDSGINIVGGDFDYTIDNVAAVVADEKPDLVCIDGPYLIKNDGKDRHERVSNNFDDFKKIGIRNKCAILTNLQFNRSAKTGQSSTISADNIGVTDVAGWNATAAYGLVQTEEMLANWEMGIKSLKIREGRLKDFKIHWNHNSMDFSEIPNDDDDDDLPDDAGAPTPGGADTVLAGDSYEDMPF